jgi:hypothetical protein
LANLHYSNLIHPQTYIYIYIYIDLFSCLYVWFFLSSYWCCKTFLSLDNYKKRWKLYSIFATIVKAFPKEFIVRTLFRISLCVIFSITFCACFFVKNTGTVICVTLFFNRWSARCLSVIVHDNYKVSLNFFQIYCTLNQIYVQQITWELQK